MPESFEQRLANVTKKAQLLTQRYALLLAQRDEALSRIHELESKLDADKKLIEQLNTRIEYLSLASNIQLSADDAEKNRAFLSELVWEIDKCIAQLND